MPQVFSGTPVDSLGNVITDMMAVAGVALGSTAVVAFGTAPAAGVVPGVNASLFAGTTGLTVSGTALNVNISSTTGNISVVGTLSNNAAAPGATSLLGVL